MNNRYFLFWVRDDKTRWRAYKKGLIATIISGLIFKVIGFHDQTAASAGCSACLAIIVWEMLRYLRQTSAASITPMPRFYSRRSAMAFGVFASLNSVLFGLLSNVSAALAFATSAKKSMEIGEDVSLSKAVFYTIILRSRTETDPQAAKACAALACAEQYTRMRSKAPEVVKNPSIGGGYAASERPVWIHGDGPTRTRLMGVPSFVLSRNTIIDSMGFYFAQVPLPKKKAPFITLVGHPSIVVRNCIVENASQLVSGMCLFAVTFRNCAIEIRSQSLAMVDVSFDNCLVNADEEFTKRFETIDIGNATRVTYYGIENG